MNTRALVFLLTAISITVLNSCNLVEHQLTKAEMRSIVESRNEQLAECFKSGDVEKLAQMYSDSAKLCPNGYHFVYGRDSIKAFWEKDFETSKTIEMNTNILTIDGNNEVIYETGLATSKIIYNDSLYNPTVKYINVWCRQSDGSYLLDIDFWNKPK